MSAQLAPPPVFKGWDNNAFPAAFGTLGTFMAGTSTPQATYVDSTQTTPNTNPVVLNFRGEANVWLDPTLSYKLILKDFFGNLLWTVDNIQGGLTFNSLTQQILGRILYPRTTGEINASVIPIDFFYLPLDPLRYGAVGDGVADDSVALNTWAAVVDATVTPNSIWTQGKTFLCGPITTVSANDVTIQMNGCTILSKPNSWPSTTYQLLLSGSRTRLIDGTLNGNQANWSVQPPAGGYLLGLGSDFHLSKMNIINSPSVGCVTGGSEGEAVDCHFDGNAGGGLQLLTASYLRFVGCTFNFNGYLFQGTYQVNGPGTGAFSVVLRFRCHHIIFAACECLQSGSDGMNTNQGSYAIKYIGCVVWGCNDGGFTIAADSTSPGTPGDAESCYDLEYVDCEAYNNWASGLTAFQTCYNVTVSGGRYYNNGRAAGILTFGSQTQNGIYISGGALGVVIDTKAYDDRQLCPITAVSGTSPRVLTATNWGLGNAGGSTFAPTAANYPRVALFNSAMVFQGFGTISSEGSGSVAITTTVNNGVTLASIAPGWFITQRLQQTGIFIDNSSTAIVKVDGFGHLPILGAAAGLKVFSGPFANNQNVLLPQETLDYTELLQNPTWDAGIGSGTTWTYSIGAGGAANYFTTAGALLRSAGCLQLSGGTSVLSSGTSTLITAALAYVQGCFVEASCWVYAINSGDAQLTLNWNTGGAFNSSVLHPGGGWKFLQIGAFLAANVSALSITVYSFAGKTNYFDTASMRAKMFRTDSRDNSYPTRNLAV